MKGGQTDRQTDRQTDTDRQKKSVKKEGRMKKIHFRKQTLKV